MSSEDEDYTIFSQDLQKLVKILKSEKGEVSMRKPGSSICAEGEIQPEDVNLQVTGIGHITFPLKSETACELKKMASPTAFGKEDQTDLDQKVCNIYVIPKTKLCVSINKIEDILEDVKTKLGLSTHCTLKAHLHNMLLYEKGQHFAFHQDTEKMDNMVGTLVVALPSAHIGGDLVIKLANETRIFSTETLSADSVKYIAFYSECRHKIEKVKEGFRIVLTYNVVLSSSQWKDSGLCNRDLNLINILKEYFEKKWYFRLQPKLVYLFDHNYTEYNFKFSSLRGFDRQVATALVAAAKELNLVVRFALADVLEVWHIEEQYPRDSFYNLLARLESWRDENDNPLNYVTYRYSDTEPDSIATSDDISCEVMEQEICWSKHNKYFHPHRIDNRYFNDLVNEDDRYDLVNEDDRYDLVEMVSEEKWYKRGAIVLWPQSCDLKMRFELNYDAEFNKLMALTNSPNNVDEIKSILEKIGDSLYDQFEKPLKFFIKLALYTKDPEIAFDICKRKNDLFQIENSHLLCELKEGYGATWCFNLLEEKFQFIRYKSFEEQFINLIEIFKEKGEDSSMINKILKHQTVTVGNDSDLKRRVKYGKLVKAAYDARSFECLDDILKTAMSDRWDGYYMAKFYTEYCKDLKDVHTDTLKDAVLKSLQETINTYKQMNVDRIEWLTKIKFPTCECYRCINVADFFKNGGKIKECFFIIEYYEHVRKNFEIQNKGLFSISTPVECGSVWTFVFEKSIDVVEDVEAKLRECETLLQDITKSEPIAVQPPV